MSTLCLQSSFKSIICVIQREPWIMNCIWDEGNNKMLKYWCTKLCVLWLSNSSHGIYYSSLYEQYGCIKLKRIFATTRMSYDRSVSFCATQSGIIFWIDLTMSVRQSFFFCLTCKMQFSNIWHILAREWKELARHWSGPSLQALTLFKWMGKN